MNRRSRLKSRTTHNWLPKGAGMWACSRCNRLQRGDGGGDLPPPRPYCPGMKRTPLKKVSPKRKEKREKRGLYMGLHRWAKEFPCIAAGCGDHVCEGPIDGHHVKSVGSGYSDWLEPDEHSDGHSVGNVAAVCRGLHRELDDINSGPQTVEQKYGIDFAAYARLIGEDFLRVWRIFH